MVYWIKMNSPIGDIHLAARDDKLVYCASAREKGSDMFIWLEKYLADEEIINKENELLRQAKGQLEDYFLGKNKTLDVDLELIGTDFRKKVWEALRTIPYGATRTYGEIARQIGRPQGPRAIGQANHHNPISYFVP